MDSNVDVRRIGLKALAYHETAFAMRIAARVLPCDGHLQREIARHLLPYEMEGVVGKPHVLAATGDGVGFRARLEKRMPRLRRLADVRFVFEQAHFCGAR